MLRNCKHTSSKHPLCEKQVHFTPWSPSVSFCWYKPITITVLLQLMTCTKSALLCSSQAIYQLHPQGTRYLTAMFRQNIDWGCRFLTLQGVTIARRVKSESFGSLLVFQTDIRESILHCPYWRQGVRLNDYSVRHRSTILISYMF